MIVVYGFGSQFTQLIARCVRELGVYCEIVPAETTLAEVVAKNPEGVILSGGPQSVYEKGAKLVDPKLFESGIPILGICYGEQLMIHLLGGEVEPGVKGEYGPVTVFVSEPTSRLFLGLSEVQQVWASHGDRVLKLAPGFTTTVRSENAPFAAIENVERKLYGVQFHPEVVHTKQGRDILKNFLYGICLCKGGWSVQGYLEEKQAQIAPILKGKEAIALLSGGVDSAVAAALVVGITGIGRIRGIHIDPGIMRKGESEQVWADLPSLGIEGLEFVDASEEFLSALSGVVDPEQKRTIIGDLFVVIMEQVLESLDLGPETYLIQGTLYTDLVESGQGKGSGTAKIKTHHNVGAPLIARLREQGRVIEPNNEIFKDEVRELGRLLRLPESMINRHPFPGPGLAIRIINQEVTAEKVALLQEADAIFLEEIHRQGLYDTIWQAFAGLSSDRATGVMGDDRAYGQICYLRAVTSVDGMTADVYDFPPGFINRVSSRIVNEVRGITRVLYDTTSKPPGTIEWE